MVTEGRTKTGVRATGRGAALACAALLGLGMAGEPSHAQTAWGGNTSVIVNESVLDSLGPGGAGAPYQPPAGAAAPGGAYPYGGAGAYSRYGGALLFPPPQVPRSTLTVAPPSPQALSRVPPIPRSAVRPTATARSQPAAPRQATRQTATAQPAPQPIAPQPPTPQPAQRQQPAQTATAAPPPPPPPTAAAETPKPAAAPKADTQTQAQAEAPAVPAPPTETAAVDDVELPPPAPLPSFTEEALPMVNASGINGQLAEAPRQTLFTGGPSPSGNAATSASSDSQQPAAPPPPPPAPEPLTAKDAEQTAPLATRVEPTEALSPGAATQSAATQSSTAQSSAAQGNQPALSTPTQPVAATQQAALPPATAAAGGEVRIAYEATQIDLDSGQESSLAPLVERLRGDERAAVRVQAYASGDASDPNKARRLSLQRALKVRKYFIDQGIRSVRVEVRALGMSGPDGSVDRVDVVPVQR